MRINEIRVENFILRKAELFSNDRNIPTYIRSQVTLN